VLALAPGEERLPGAAGAKGRHAPPGGERKVCGRGRLEGEPIEGVRAQREEVGCITHGRESGVTEEFHGNCAGNVRKVQLNGLGEAREVRDDENALPFVLADEGENAAVVALNECHAAEAECL